jgi:hypothetical protein
MSDSDNIIKYTRKHEFYSLMFIDSLYQKKLVQTFYNRHYFSTV